MLIPSPWRHSSLWFPPAADRFCRDEAAPAPRFWEFPAVSTWFSSLDGMGIAQKTAHDYWPPKVCDCSSPNNRWNMLKLHEMKSHSLAPYSNYRPKGRHSVQSWCECFLSYGHVHYLGGICPNLRTQGTTWELDESDKVPTAEDRSMYSRSTARQGGPQVLRIPTRHHGLSTEMDLVQKRSHQDRRKKTWQDSGKSSDTAADYGTEPRQN